MKKYLSILYIAFSVFSFGQFRDNAFDEKEISSPYVDQSGTNHANTNTDNVFSHSEDDNTNTNSLMGGPIGGEQPEGPGNPGNPVPIDGFVTFFILIGFGLIIHFQKKSKKINT